MTAVLHYLAPYAKVIGIDHLQGLVDLAKANLQKDGLRIGAGEGELELICGDGRLGELDRTRSKIYVSDRLLTP